MSVPQGRKPRAIRDPRADERRRAFIFRAAATLVVVAIAAGIGIWLIVTKDSKSDSTSAAGPSVAVDGFYKISGATGSPKVTVQVTEDFQCPACRALESSMGSTLESLRSMPDVSLQYRPVAILDRVSTTDYSTRSASASACVAEQTAGNGDFSTWLKFHDALYAQQPEEGSAGLPDSTLASIAVDAGAPKSVTQCIESDNYEKWVAQNTQKASEQGLQGTPQVEINGKTVQVSSPEQLLAMVNAARNG